MDETLKRKAYLEGMRLKKSGLEPEIIYARLEKQGNPPELARQVIKNIYIESEKEARKDAEEDFNLHIVLAAIGILLGIAFPFIFPGYMFLPIGLVGGGLFFAIKAYYRMRR